ncbi:hypothetical protein B0T24DRAFT_645558 [Lasiosphaeria ovina]|uniref:HNH nuclease domain-containing protein n=1 Tax=Lasiosphaeria ovina TaxID=92902 RepID=A0AAE0TXI5_9PEZI|nr:hypothetical protein B0T24DRAFT_645558 [Lasiosphaeria ovina]
MLPACLNDIRFWHHGYDSHNLLLTLPRVDSTPSISTYRVYYRTALLACQIIAGNAFANSYFSLDKAGQYFQDWEFPNDRIPDWWPPVDAGSVITVDCGITKAGYAIEKAHLVPKEENRNLVRIRKDIYHSFNARWFVIVLKIITLDSSLQPSLQYVTYITLESSLHYKSRAYLFTRFAWAILFQAKLFVTAGQHRHVIRVSRDIDGKIEYKTEYCTGIVLENAYGGGGSKTATPRKRRAGEDTLEMELRTALRQVIPQQGVASED